MMTDTTPTSEQITTLRDEAAQHGDGAMATICTAALDGDHAALAEVARCLREAAAQRDD